MADGKTQPSASPTGRSTQEKDTGAKSICTPSGSTPISGTGGDPPRDQPGPTARAQDTNPRTSKLQAVKKKASSLKIPKTTPPLTRGRKLNTTRVTEALPGEVGSTQSLKRKAKEQFLTPKSIGEIKVGGRSNPYRGSPSPSIGREDGDRGPRPAAERPIRDPQLSTPARKVASKEDPTADKPASRGKSTTRYVESLGPTSSTDSTSCPNFPFPCMSGILCDKEHDYTIAEPKHIAAHLDSLLTITRTTSLQLEEIRLTQGRILDQMEKTNKKLDDFLEEFFH